MDPIVYNIVNNYYTFSIKKLCTNNNSVCYKLYTVIINQNGEEWNATRKT